MISTHDYYVVILYYCNFIQKIRNMPSFIPRNLFWAHFGDFLLQIPENQNFVKIC